MPRGTKASSDEPWFAVKCLFSHPDRASDADGNLYEERITIWRASTFEEAFALAEAEAREYAADDCQFVRAAQAFHLFEESVRHGSEVWSVMRGSHMQPELYIETFCATPRDRAAYSSSDPDESSTRAFSI
jgi:hypothetical protein